MPRKRMINPTIWEDPSFNSLSRDARLAFIGCISNADDDGYLRGDFGSLRRLFFGFEEQGVSAWYEELKVYKNLHFYEVNGEMFCHLLNWDKHQTQREDRRIKSVYPLCVICQSVDGQLPAEVKLSKVKLSKVNTVPELKKQFFENPLMQKIKETYPDRDYNFQFDLMCDWWIKTKKKLPQNLSAFSNWLKNTKPNQSEKPRIIREKK